MAGFAPTTRDFHAHYNAAASYAAGKAAGVAQAQAAAPTTPAPAQPSDFQTLANALTSIYGGGGVAVPQAQVPTAVVPVDTGSGGSSVASLRPVLLLLGLAAVGWAVYHWWKKHHTGG